MKKKKRKKKEKKMTKKEKTYWSQTSAEMSSRNVAPLCEK